MGKKFFWLLAAAGALFFWRYGYQASLRYLFKVSGTVSLSPTAVPPLPANTMLFVVARNDGGVPVAVKKVINPRFPYQYEITPSSLIMPDLLTRRLSVEAHLNTHGSLGVPGRGDLKGEHGQPVQVRGGGADIKLFSIGR